MNKKQLNSLDDLFLGNNLATLTYIGAWSGVNSILLTKIRQIGS